MKWFTVGLFILSQSLMAETSSQLNLQGFVPRTSKTAVRRVEKNSSQVLWLLSNQTNSEHPLEGQRIEVEGLDQAGIESVVSKVVSSNRTVQYEILIKQLEDSKSETQRPVFLKISAN